MNQAPTITRTSPKLKPAAIFRGDALDNLLAHMFRGNKEWLSGAFAAPAAPKQIPAATGAGMDTECPFCRLSDQLESIDWCNELPDGSQYEGPAIRCNRCFAIAPTAAWLSPGNSFIQS